MLFTRERSGPLTGLAIEPGLAVVIKRYLEGKISPEVALMEMLCESESAETVRSAVTAAAQVPDMGGGPREESFRQRLEALVVVAAEHETGCAHIARMLATGPDSSAPATTVEEGLAFVERLFDWSVRESEEASVALYSLGDPVILERATAEIVALFERWGVLGEDKTVLQIGCGIGRIESALAPLVGDAYGIDVSGEMIARGRRRCGEIRNVHLAKTNGRDLSMFAHGMFDLVFAVDTFPYLVQAGAELVDAYFRETRRVLRPGGTFAILNYGYRGELAEHQLAVHELAKRHVFELLIDGERPFELWNGAVWRLIVV